MQEPLSYFFEKYGIDLQNIKHIVCGEKYVAVQLKNGQVGVCATLNNYVNIDVRDLRFPDLNKTTHRIVLNAYFNALFNYQNTYDTSIDIFDKMDFKPFKKIVMVGFFRSLVEKFEREGIPLTIFDKFEEGPKLTDMKLQLEEISKADALILTSTSVFNNTFMELIDAASKNCNIFMLGPSTILSKEMFQYKNIRILFGSVFEKNDIMALKIIQSGGGTKQFMPFMKKVFLHNEQL